MGPAWCHRRRPERRSRAVTDSESDTYTTPSATLGTTGAMGAS